MLEDDKLFHIKRHGTETKGYLSYSPESDSYRIVFVLLHPRLLTWQSDPMPALYYNNLPKERLNAIILDSAKIFFEGVAGKIDLDVETAVKEKVTSNILYGAAISNRIVDSFNTALSLNKILSKK